MKILVAINQSRVLYDFKREVVESFASLGHDTLLSYLPDFRGSYFEQRQFKIIPAPLEPRGMNPIKDARLYRYYCRLLKRERPDVVFTFTIKPNVYCGYACRRLGAPYWGTISGLGEAVHARGPLGALSTWLYRQGLCGARGVFCQNDAIVDFALQHGLTTPERVIRVNGSGVNLQYHTYQPYPSEEDGVKILLPARLTPAKGVREFLATARRFHEREPNVRFQIMGAPETGSSLFETVQSAALRGEIEYLGYQTDPRPYYASASAVALPSYHEGLSNVLLEGAATGRPLLASNVPGCAETFIEGQTGFGFAARDAQAFCQAVERFVRTPRFERESMGRRGREYVAARFDRREAARVYVAALEGINR
ncbi:MAG: glycosyltransferase family 4 protein [Planctomycetia bacterium]|nr:glycosyltransferase family 4 protein [Planctomycetia bacterium]